MQEAPNTPIRHASRLSVQTCRSPHTAADRHRQSGKVLVCANWRRPTRWLFRRDRAFFRPRPYPSMDCIWRYGCMSSHFMAKSVLRPYNGPHPNKHTHTNKPRTHTRTRAHAHAHTRARTHTRVRSVTPQAPCGLIWKFAALVKTPLRHDTLAEKRVNEILKCFSVCRTLHIGGWERLHLWQTWEFKFTRSEFLTHWLWGLSAPSFIL